MPASAEPINSAMFCAGQVYTSFAPSFIQIRVEPEFGKGRGNPIGRGVMMQYSASLVNEVLE